MRLIDADALKDEIRTDIMGGLNYEYFIDHAPTVEERQTGEWKLEKFPHKDVWLCNKCGKGGYRWYDYCPWCGADMREKRDVNMC